MLYPENHESGVCYNLTSDKDEKSVWFHQSPGECTILYENAGCTGEFFPFYDTDVNLTQFRLKFQTGSDTYTYKTYKFANRASSYSSCDILSFSHDFFHIF